MASKAHKHLGFIRRNLQGAYKHRATAYTSLVKSKLEYCASIWGLTAKRSIDILEWVQRQFARWALMQYGAASMTKLLKDLHWAELVDRCRDQCFTLFFKLLNRCHPGVWLCGQQHQPASHWTSIIFNDHSLALSNPPLAQYCISHNPWVEKPFCACSRDQPCHRASRAGGQRSPPTVCAPPPSACCPFWDLWST